MQLGPHEAPSLVAAVVVAPPTATIVVGGTVRLTATVIGTSGLPVSGRRAGWSSSAWAIATVYQAGDLVAVITGAAPGTVTISAFVEQKWGTATITVIAPSAITIHTMPATANPILSWSLTPVAMARVAAGRELSGRPLGWMTRFEITMGEPLHPKGRGMPSCGEPPGRSASP